MRILYAPEVVADLAEVRDWYEGRSDGLGEEFIRMAYAGFEELTEFPFKYEKVHGSVRRALMRRFPYSIYYQINDGCLTVYGVFHCSREPRFVEDSLEGRE